MAAVPKRLFRPLGLALLAAAAVAATPPSPVPEDYGPQPTFPDAIRIGEAAIRDRMIDPDSARIEWPYNFIAGTLKPLLGHRNAGYYTCGFVNARNRMGGYTGKVWFLIMERDGKVTSLDIGAPDQIEPASATCPGLVKKGFFPAAPAAQPVTPAAAMAAAQSGADAAAQKGGWGISFAPTPYGLMLVAVAEGGAAKAAGLKQGEVVEALNGISVKGMPLEQAAQLLGRAGTTLTFTIIGVGDVKVTRH
jgi:hypothetical protein